MRIQNISFNNLHKSQTNFTAQNQQKNNKDINTDKMQVYEQNYTYPRPFILPASLYTPEENEPEEYDGPCRAIFRDDELFDPKRDYDKRGYMEYDEDDIKAPKHFFNPIHPDYLLNKDCDFDLNGCFQTEELDNELFYKEPIFSLSVVIPEPPKMNSKIDDFTDEDDREIYIDSTKIMKNDKHIVNNKLQKNIDQKLDEYPLEIVAAVANTAKLQDRFGNETVDYALFEQGFKLAKQYPVADVEQIMNSCVLSDRDENEYFSNQMFNFTQKLLTDLPVEEAVNCSEYAVSYNKFSGYYYDLEKGAHIKALLKNLPLENALAEIEKLQPDKPIDNSF